MYASDFTYTAEKVNSFADYPPFLVANEIARKLQRGIEYYLITVEKRCLSWIMEKANGKILAS